MKLFPRGSYNYIFPNKLNSNDLSLIHSYQIALTAKESKDTHSVSFLIGLRWYSFRKNRDNAIPQTINFFIIVNL